MVDTNILASLGLDMNNSYLNLLMPNNKTLQENINFQYDEIYFFTDSKDISQSQAKKDFFLKKVTTNFPNENPLEKEYRAKNCFNIWSVITAEFSVWYGEIGRALETDKDFYQILRNILVNPNGIYAVIESHLQGFPKGEALRTKRVFVNFRDVVYLDSEKVLFWHGENILYYLDSIKQVAISIKEDNSFDDTKHIYNEVGKKYGFFGVFSDEQEKYYECLLSDSFKYALDFLRAKSFSDYEKYKTPTQTYETLESCSKCSGSGFASYDGSEGVCGNCKGKGVIANSQFKTNVLSGDELPPNGIYQSPDASYLKEIFEQTKYKQDLFLQSIFADTQKVFQAEETKRINNEKYYSFLNTLGGKIVYVLNDLQQKENEILNVSERKEIAYSFSPLTYEPSVTVNDIQELRNAGASNSVINATEVRYLTQQNYPDCEIKKLQLVDYFTSGYNYKEIVELNSVGLLSNEDAQKMLGIDKAVNDLILQMGCKDFGATDLNILIQKLK
jgi:hypothetical protein